MNTRTCILLTAALLSGAATPLTAAPGQPSVHTTQRRVTEIAKGVYVVEHPDATDFWTQGNTTIVIGTRGVLVVDASLLPATAREDIAEIRRLTNLPVRYLLITHWHIDHSGGASEYAAAFPGLEIVAQEATSRVMNGKNPDMGAKFALDDGPLVKEATDLEKQLSSGLGADGKPLTDHEKAPLPDRIAQWKHMHEDFKSFRYQPPTLTFDHHLDLDLGGRTAQLIFLGRANTHGDAMLFLPEEKILVTGDTLVWPEPYLMASDPFEWRVTMRAMAALEPAIFVPGHGVVQRDRKYFNLVMELLDSAVSQAEKISPSITKPEEMHVDIERFRKLMAGEDRENLTWFKVAEDGLNKALFEELKGVR